MRSIQYSLLSLSLGLLASCSVSVPDDAVRNGRKAVIFPEYDDAVIPPNIAPLNFLIEDVADSYITRIYTASGQVESVVEGKQVEIPEDEWHSLLAAAKGDTLFTDVYMRTAGKWYVCATRKNPVAQEDIDPYITYRLIEPSYVDYEEMTLNQRNLTNFEEVRIYNNMRLSDGDNGQCINCHAVQNYNRSGRAQFHVRQNMGGTVLTDGKNVRKVNLKTEQTLSAGVYPAWHPVRNLIAYSVNETGQVFHTRDLQKVEVIDMASDLILYDADSDKVYDIDRRADEFETFPAWSPDGRTLYYVSAHYEQQTADIDAELGLNYEQLKYDIYRRPFDEQTLKFGDQDTVFAASRMGKSAVLPRISPDGRYLLFAMADYGNFHVWHKSSDLYVMDLKRWETRSSSASSDSLSANDYVYPLTEANSKFSESYHSWSSNGRWILFSSRRMDGNYTRLFISYFDKDGHAHRPFVVPQKHPKYYHQQFKSYNVPEWMVAPVKPSLSDYTDAIRKEAVPATYGGSSLLVPQTSDVSVQHKSVDASSGASSRAGSRVGY
ncbi:MAG: hypothetical protein NC206_04930 [Bacteroides sp.]|nr:hypothetical protein [Roseburia sp.]MCM1346409.1 hypothetical protein [Bacteroides sp.]MCM1420948.1 hypothetical protein [Bacteroides sp.]